MKKTTLIFNDDTRAKMLAGVNTIANAVSTTLGPRGQNVAIAKADPMGNVYERVVLHDGVSVARAIDLSDEYENMGAQLLKQAAQKQVDMVGDGTTAVMVLAQAIVQECMKAIGTGVNPMSLRRGLEMGVDKLISALEFKATPVKTFEQMKYVATISAEDKELGILVARTLEKIGERGIVTVEESKNADTTIEHQSGMQIGNGMVHELFRTSTDRVEAVIDNAHILVTDKNLYSFAPLIPFLNKCLAKKVPLVILAEDFSGDTLPSLLQNKLEGKLQVLCVKAPSFGQNQKDILQDIAILTGAKYISDEAGYDLEKLEISDLGKCDYVSATKSETIIVGGRGKIEDRIKEIEESVKKAESEFDREKIKERLAKLTNGVAVIRVGGITEVEMKERRERVLDAVAATKAAVDGGIVAGGEIIYLTVRQLLDQAVPAEKILYNALFKPFQKLITNADMSEYEVGELMKGKDSKYGIDVTDGKVKDMVKAGIIDPVLVPINAIRNAVSVAVQIITSNVIIIPEKEEKK